MGVKCKLVLQNGLEFEGVSFGANSPRAGETVFATGMTGYPEAFTDPSFEGQILAMTYPLVGNYGVSESTFWENSRLHITGLIVSNYIDTPSHFQSKQTLSQWLHKEGIPGIEIKDTRLLTQHLRDNGSQLGKIIFEKDIPFYDPNNSNLVSEVSTRKVTHYGNGKITVVLLDCGAKRNIVRSLVKRNVHVVSVPWDYKLFEKHNDIVFDGVLISNGPGDPKKADVTISTIKKALENNIPTLGICLGSQLLALAAGGDTYKLKFGHRSQNQPSILQKTNRCYITTQNHGFAVGILPPGFDPWFINANDNSNEGIIHHKKPFMSVQFHPEATPGPVDTEWIFDMFIERIKEKK